MSHLPCYYLSRRIGTIQGGCGSAVIRTCLAADVPSSLCTPELRGKHRVMDGPLRYDSAGSAKPQWRTIYSYDRGSLDDGRPLDPDWILVCTHCPFHRDPPAAVARMYAEREQVLAAIRRYESTTTLEDREAAIELLATDDRQAIAAELGDGPDDLQLSRDRV